MKVLIVDDDILITEQLSEDLNSEIGIECLQAYSGNDAIKIVKNHSGIAVIISDFNMPNGTGGDVYKFMQSTNKNIPFIFITSDELSTHEDLATFYEDHPKNIHLPKPFDFIKLCDTVNDILRLTKTM